MFASQEGKTDVVELLIKHNADVNARKLVRLHIHYIDREIGRLLFVHAYKHVCVPLSLDGWTALMAASQEGKTDVVELLIKHNADVNGICHHMPSTILLVCSSRPGGKHSESDLATGLVPKELSHLGGSGGTLSQKIFEN